MRFKMHKIGVAAFLAVFFLCVGVSYALNVTIEPAKAQRSVDGYVRVHIYANSAVNLISFGVKVTFNPIVLEVVDAQKYTAFTATASGWVMDADGDYTTTNDRYTTPNPVIDPAGSVTMIGGRLIGQSTTGLSNKVLLGWIKFKAKANGNSNLAVSVAKAPPFDNFVGIGGTVYDGDLPPVGAPVNKGIICVLANACQADANGNLAVDPGDSTLLRNAFGKSYPDPGYNVNVDFNANGAIDPGDSTLLRNEFGRTCPICP